MVLNRTDLCRTDLITWRHTRCGIIVAVRESCCNCIPKGNLIQISKVKRTSNLIDKYVVAVVCGDDLIGEVDRIGALPHVDPVLVRKLNPVAIDIAQALVDFKDKVVCV